MRLLCSALLALGMFGAVNVPATAAPNSETVMAAPGYECPKCHVKSAKAGTCSHCKVALTPVSRYECAHCNVKSAKAGNCPKCNMAMTRIKPGKM